MKKKLKQIGNQGVLAMICDSTNVFNPGRSGSELDVRKSLLKIMENKQKRIIVTSFASNVARMESIFYCAERIGRQISLVGRSMHRIYKAAKQCGYLNGLIEPIDPREAKKISREKRSFGHDLRFYKCIYAWSSWIRSRCKKKFIKNNGK